MGDGKSIKVWGDRWLPTPTYFSIQSPQGVLSSTTKVAALIDHESGGWNTSLINEVFTVEEAKMIINIHLSPNLPHDRLIWSGTTNVNFLVRSAYHLGKEL